MKKIKINAKFIARIAAVQSMYKELFYESIEQENTKEHYTEDTQDEIINLFEEVDSKKYKIKVNHKFLNRLLLLRFNNAREIDMVINSLCSNKTKQLDIIVFSILRIAITELKYLKEETPYKVAISQYTDIAGEMLNLPQVGFVNSILDSFSKTEL